MARKRPSPRTRPQPFRDAWLAVALGAAVFLLYLPSLGSGLVYDAESEILISTYIHTPAHFWDVITLRVLGQDVLDFNRPAHLFSLMVDSLIWGRTPFGYHLTSNLLHAFTAALLFLLLLRLLPADFAKSVQARVAAALGVLVFAVHPAQVEAVAQVTFREDQLAAFFMLLALFLATEFPGANVRRAVTCGVACAFSLFLAAASKETGYAGPFLLMLYWLLYRRSERTKAWMGLLAGTFLAVGLFVTARFVFEPQNSEVFLTKPVYLGGSLAKVFELQPRLWAFLLWIVAWPARLSADYMPENAAWITLPWALAVLALFLLFQAALSWKSRLALMGAAVFWLGLAPVSNFIPIYRPVADRFLYFPMVGVAMLVCALLSILFSKRKLYATGVATFIVMIVLLVSGTWRRQKVFASSLNLWRDTVQKSPSSSTAANNLGYAFLKTNDSEAALRAFQYSLDLTKEQKADSWAGAALALDKLGQREQAEEALGKAIALDGRYGTPQKLMEMGTCDQENADGLNAIIRRLNVP